MKIVFIGAGNLATRVSLALKEAGEVIVQVYSHTENSARTLGEKIGCSYTTDLKKIYPDADLYIFSVKDSVLPEVIAGIPSNDALWVHTAGSISREVFAGKQVRYGVFYPLQTFSKEREVDFSVIPFFVEANRRDDAPLLQNLAGKLSKNVRETSLEERRQIHLAAVFACNFTNHMYAIAAELLEKEQLPFDLLIPLIDETAAKIHEMPPLQAQTGPAVRYDRNVIGKHLDMLQNKTLKTLYTELSQNIHTLHNDKEQYL